MDSDEDSECSDFTPTQELPIFASTPPAGLPLPCPVKPNRRKRGAPPPGFFSSGGKTKRVRFTLPSGQVTAPAPHSPPLPAPVPMPMPMPMPTVEEKKKEEKKTAKTYSAQSTACEGVDSSISQYFEFKLKLNEVLTRRSDVLNDDRTFRFYHSYTMCNACLHRERNGRYKDDEDIVCVCCMRQGSENLCCEYKWEGMCQMCGESFVEVGWYDIVALLY